MRRPVRTDARPGGGVWHQMPTVPEGNVISQNPVAGTSCPGGTLLTLTVSSGPNE